MKKKYEKKILNFLAMAGMKSAVKAAGSASIFGYHQPKEPMFFKKK